MSDDRTQERLVDGAGIDPGGVQAQHAAPLPPVTGIQTVGITALTPVPSRTQPITSVKLLGVMDYDQLVRRVTESGSTEYVVEGLIPRGQIVLLVGDSGLGKSPFLYQLALSVAGGIAFLGRRCQQGLVIYFDFENSLPTTANIVERQAQYLGFECVPVGLHFWNFGACSENYGSRGNTVIDMVLARKPDLAIIDTLSAYRPLIEEKNSVATHSLQQLKSAIRSTGTTFICVHHLKKPSTRAEDAPTPSKVPGFSIGLNKREARAL